jgi:2-polyprenyl-3-methyl-5-hydroxy-6-metoxy-1,4-benzoquinol methylase
MARRVVEYFDSQAGDFRDSYKQSRDFQSRYALWTGLIDRYGVESSARSCIDLGCGPGLFSLYVADRGIPTFGIDASPQMLALAEAEKQRRGLKNVQFRRAALPLDSGLPLQRADLILCSSVLEYIADWDKTVAGIANLLNPGGCFLVSLPNSQSLYRIYERLKYRCSGKPEYYRHVRHVVSESTAIRYFESFGFVCSASHFYGDEPLISQLASRVVSERFSKNLFVLVLTMPEAVGFQQKAGQRCA